MTTQPTDTFHVSLSIQALNASDSTRDDLIAAILKLAPASTLYAQTPAIQAEMATLSSSYTAYKTASGTYAQTAQLLKTDLAAKIKARAANNKSVERLRALVQTNATSLDDITGMAMPAYEGRPLAPPMVPPLVDLVLGKKGSGRATAKAHETGATRHKYAAESSPDPIGTTWTMLAGTGKTRKLAGASGTKVWVRMALVYRGQQSDWSTPVLVTLP